jgi:predicted cupin superfamily sugar epimerase
MELEEVIKSLKLEKHPKEGGWFRETYRSDEKFDGNSLPSRYQGDRAYSTLIYYLISADRFSGFHRVESDEIFHFYLGDSACLCTIAPDGSARETILGSNIGAGQSIQSLVPHGFWQAVYLPPGGKWALLGCTVSPGFEYVDFEDGNRQSLIEEFPQHADLITRLTTG